MWDKLKRERERERENKLIEKTRLKKALTNFII
jgi:hypothetical protein